MVIPANPTNSAAASRASARWLVSLFAASVITQRISLPGGIVPALLVLILGWCAYGLALGILEFDRRRSRLYLLAAALTAGSALAQQMMIVDPLVSVTSWGLFMTVWLPATLRLVERGRAAIRLAFEGCVRVGTWLAVACMVMLGAQYAGLKYVDYLPLVIPKTLLVQGYVITYPLEYGSPIYRANAWIGLEPSIVSLQLGVCLILALTVRASIPRLVILILGMACTVSGSGIFVFGIGVLVMLLTPMRRQLVRYPLATGIAVIGVMLTPMGELLASRVTELAFAGSSTRLRAVEPYRFLWPEWTSDATVTLLGRGAGSSQQLILDTNRAGLLVTSPIKVLFDYGLIAGVALAVFLIYCYFGAPSLAIALSLFASSWVLQPGTTTVVLALPTMLFVTWWAPRQGRYLETDPYRRRRATAVDAETEAAEVTTTRVGQTPSGATREQSLPGSARHQGAGPSLV